MQTKSHYFWSYNKNRNEQKSNIDDFGWMG